MDQANTLRRLMRLRKKPPQPEAKGDLASPTILTFASGKGGVGKSSLVANLGTMLARRGSRVLLVDGDLDLANLDLLLGVKTGATLEEVLDGSATLREAIVTVEDRLWLLPSGAGHMDLPESDPEMREKLVAFFDAMPLPFDFILVDAGAGIQPSVLSLHHPAYESVVILTPEPASLTEAYTLIKLLRRHSGITRANVIVNQVTDAQQALSVFRGLADVTARFSDIELNYLGHCPRDEKITQSVMKRKILLDWDGGADSVASLELLAKRLRSKGTNEGDFKRKSLPQGSPEQFWRNLLTR